MLAKLEMESMKKKGAVSEEDAARVAGEVEMDD